MNMLEHRRSLINLVVILILLLGKFKTLNNQILINLNLIINTHNETAWIWCQCVNFENK